LRTGPHEIGEQKSNGRNEKIVSPWKLAVLSHFTNLKNSLKFSGGSSLPPYISDPAKNTGKLYVDNEAQISFPSIKMKEDLLHRNLVSQVLG